MQCSSVYCAAGPADPRDCIHWRGGTTLTQGKKYEEILLMLPFLRLIYNNFVGLGTRLAVKSESVLKFGGIT